MSKNLDLIQIETFENAVSVSNDHCLKFLGQQSVSSEDIILIVRIGYDSQRHLFEAKQEHLSITTNKLQLFLIAYKLIEHEVLWKTVLLSFFLLLRMKPRTRAWAQMSAISGHV